MSIRDAFEERCAQVCREREWSFADGRVEVRFDDGRQQVVELEFFTFDGREHVRFCSVIGDARRIDSVRLTTALDLNYRLPHGALAKRNDDLVIVATLGLEDANPGEIAATLAYLSETADHYEKSMFGPDTH